MPRVSIAILSWNGRHHLEHCLPALAAQHDPGVEVETLVLDNGSIDGTREWVEEHHPEVKLVRSDVNLGFCAGNNRLVEACSGEMVILLNNDTRPQRQWLGSLVQSLASAPADVAAVSGAIVDWQGERLDFGRGLMTFDGHAFQWHYGRPLADADMPAAGDELLFACGGNMIIRRDAYLGAGGFDRDYFAYLEDVDLGWRLWARGQRVLFAPEAMVHHRSMATSQLLGNANRGFLFERNAFATVFKNLDAELWPRLMPAVWMTLVHRTQTLMVQNNPGGGLLTLDPYAGLIANTASPESSGSAVVGPPAEAEPSPLVAPPSPTVPRTSLAEKWKGYGPGEFVRRGLRKAARTLLPGFVFEDAGPSAQLVDPRTLAQLQAQTWILGRLDELAAKRQTEQAERRRSDREIFERFPLAIVPTYPGDERLFASKAFEEALGEGVPTVRHALDEVMPDG